MSWRVSKIFVRGVKGVLDRSGDFDLSDGRSFAIYAPNSSGKSGYADALEYLFSRDGTVEHLGQGGFDSEHGGRHALPHVLAGEKGITPSVSITLRPSDGNRETIEFTREVKTGQADPLSTQISEVIASAPAHRILRQHDLRRFVVDMGPRDKYSELSRWLGLERLERVLAHLTTTGNELDKAGVDHEFSERMKDVTNHTNGQVHDYEVASILEWCNAAASKHLQRDFSIRSVTDLDPVVDALRGYRDQKTRDAGNSSDRLTAKQSLEQFSRRFSSTDSPVSAFATALQDLQDANASLRTAEIGALERDFQRIWEVSKELLGSAQVAKCPVCSTYWSRTEHGSQRSALSELEQNLNRLKGLREAQEHQKSKQANLTAVSHQLQQALETLEDSASALLLEGLAKESARLREYLSTLTVENDTPVTLEPSGLSAEIQTSILDPLNTALPTIAIEGAPAEAQAVDEAIGQILGLQGALERLQTLQREHEELEAIRSGFETISNAIQDASSNLVDGVILSLRHEVESVYRKIHPNSVVPNVHVSADTKNKALHLRIDFHSTHRTVPPSGYLSESKINTLGLAIFVSCVRMFNREFPFREFPFMVLDDIVSSYDAEHRARLVDVIAEELNDFQVFLTTHDERFYAMLKSRLAGTGWRFERITGWDLVDGPKRESDRLDHEMVSSLISQGDCNVAGNAVRRYMEEWLDQKCTEYAAMTLHRRGPREFERTLFDFWDPFVTRIRRVKGRFFADRIEPQECYRRLVSNHLINYYSHSQANPYTWGTMSDVKYVWEEFTNFQKLFACHSCWKDLKFDNRDDRMYCTCGGAIFQD